MWRHTKPSLHRMTDVCDEQQLELQVGLTDLRAIKLYKQTGTVNKALVSRKKKKWSHPRFGKLLGQKLELPFCFKQDEIYRLSKMLSSENNPSLSNSFLLQPDGRKYIFQVFRKSVADF